MIRSYTRQSLEEKKNIRSAVIFGFLTILLLAGFIFIGFPILAKISNFVSDFTKIDNASVKDDTVPPGPPHLDSLPQAVNKDSISLTGSTENGAIVVVTLNGTESEIVADNEGEFSLTLSLQKGENSLFAISKDQAGNVSQKTATVSIVFDNTPPKLELTEPSDGAEFFGEQQRQITLKGKTEAGANLTVNDRFVRVEEGGDFSYTGSLVDGDNTFEVKAVDKAGNSQSLSLTLKFSP